MFNRFQKLVFDRFASNDDLIVLSHDSNGFERERAVRKMMEKSDIVFLEALLIRVNDWVPLIRDLAGEAIKELMVDANKQAFIERIDSIWQLKNKGRCDHSLLIREISEFILKNVSQEELIEKIRTGHRTLARIAFELLSKTLPAQDLVRLALISKDIVVIKKAGSYLYQLNGDDFESVFRTMIGSSNAYLRCIMFQVGIKKIPEQIQNSYVHMLVDNSADIRLVSINFFKTHNFGVKDFYLQSLINANKAKIRANAILGIGQARYADCADTIKPYLVDSLATIREAAFRALYSFHPNDSAVRRLVLDNSPKVSKTALFLIRKHEEKIEWNELMGWFESAQSHANIGLLQLARLSGKWAELILILKFFKKDPDVYLMTLKNWLKEFNKDQDLPSQEQISLIQEMQQITVKNLDEQVLGLLKFTLKPFNILF